MDHGLGADGDLGVECRRHPQQQPGHREQPQLQRVAGDRRFDLLRLQRGDLRLGHPHRPDRLHPQRRGLHRQYGHHPAHDPADHTPDHPAHHHPAADRPGPPGREARPRGDLGPQRLRQPRLVALARHRPGQRRLQRLPRRHQGQLRPADRRDRLPRLRRRRRRQLHRAGRGRRQRAGRLTGVAVLRRRLPRRADLAAGRRHHPRRRRLHLRGQRRLRRRPRRRRPARSGPEVVPHQLQGQLAVRLHRRHDHGRHHARRHPAVAHRPGPQHPLRRALHAVPGLRLRRRRQGRGRDEDRRRHHRRHRQGDRQLQRRLPQLLRLRPVGTRVPERLQRADRRRDADGQLRPAARHRLILGRQLRQPGGPLPGRHRLPRRQAALDHHGPRLLHAYGDRRLGLAGRQAHRALEVRLQRLGQQRIRRPGRPPAGHRRPRRRRQGRDRVRRHGRGRQRRPAVEHRAGPRRRAARRRPRPLAPRPGGLQGRRGHLQARRLVRRRQDRQDPVVQPQLRLRQRPRGLRRRVRGQPRRRVLVGRRQRPVQHHGPEHRPQARLGELPRLVGRRPGARTRGRHAHRQVRHQLRRPAADRLRRALQQRDQGHPEPVGRPLRRLARGGDLAHHRQPGAADLRHPRPHRPAHHHAAARHAVPHRHRLAEHRLQPAAAPQLLHRQQHADRAAPHRLHPLTVPRHGRAGGDTRPPARPPRTAPGKMAGCRSHSATPPPCCRCCATAGPADRWWPRRWSRARWHPTSPTSPTRWCTAPSASASSPTARSACPPRTSPSPRRSRPAGTCCCASRWSHCCPTGGRTPPTP
ncbi:hypothetical protein SBRY_40672 [Actinacidiphila bryophytorum]|uniref:Uncharacterized protein n=1 Tax=Actinacidiphila bryophytorum TaxID=1436133 RepID=A0A9W4H342_9ACTN|nr:hypothetical protein SBRY_40672 [Actinacidiphila bryophytorum]